jgi:L-lactate dehydrogenase complex protein LldG
MSDETAFLKRIRAALGDAALRRSAGDGLFLSRDPFSTLSEPKQAAPGAGQDQQALLGQLIAAAAAISLQVIEKPDPGAVGDAIVDLALSATTEWSADKPIVAWDHPLIRQLDLEQRLQRHGLALTIVAGIEDTREDAGQGPLRRSLAEALIGVTGADFCLADTATLVMKTGPGRARSVSLLPSIHVAVIHRRQILPDLRTLMARLTADQGRDPESLGSCLTFISGPSKTADIEATLVLGAHGPREVHLFILP